MTQYFGYRRHNGENINAYLVRESLFYEEFVESLMELKGAQGDVMKDLETIDETSESESESAGGDSRPGYKRVPTEEPAADLPRASDNQKYMKVEFLAGLNVNGALGHWDSWKAAMAQPGARRQSGWPQRRLQEFACRLQIRPSS